MFNILRTAVASTAFLVFAGASVAQPPDWYHQREERYRGERWRSRLFNEVREDLDHVQANAFTGRDEYNIVRTKRELDELQRDLAAGRYEEPRLDGVISALRR